MLLIRAHGNHFAARPVDASVSGRLDKDFLTLTMPERTFGAVTLQLGKEAGMWESRMRELRHGRIARSRRLCGSCRHPAADRRDAELAPPRTGQIRRGRHADLAAWRAGPTSRGG